MKRIGAASAAALFLAFGASAVAGAQGKKEEKPAKAPHEAKAQPAPKAEKPAPTPHVVKQAIQRAPKPKPVEQAKKAPAPHAQKAVVARVQKPAQATHLAKRELAVAREEQEKRLKQQEKQAAQYRKFLEQQNKFAQKREAELVKQNRKAYSRFLQQYYTRLARQQRQLLVARDYSRDPYITSPYVYQYAVSGSPRYTNQYGADVLKQAVNYGYQQGYQAGQADRQDGSAANYRNSYPYTDANYGYTGNYVSQSDYNYYFRQGLQRGYDDGYYTRSQYGSSLNGSTSILGTVLAAVLKLTSIR